MKQIGNKRKTQSAFPSPQRTNLLTNQKDKELISTIKRERQDIAKLLTRLSKETYEQE